MHSSIAYFWRGYGLFLERLSSINAVLYLQIKTKYGSRKMGFLGALIIPFVTISMMYCIAVFIRNRQPGNMPLEVFILSGMFIWLTYQGSMNAFIGLMKNSPSPLKIHSVVNSFDVNISQLVFILFPLISVTVLISIALYLMNFDIVISNFPLSMLTFLGSAMFGGAVGVVFGVLGMYSEVFTNIKTVVNRALFLMSGIFFSIDELPDALYEFVKYIPLVHLIEGLRLSMSYTYPARSMLLPFAFQIIAVILLVAVLLNSVRRRTKEQ